MAMKKSLARAAELLQADAFPPGRACTERLWLLGRPARPGATSGAHAAGSLLSGGSSLSSSGLHQQRPLSQLARTWARQRAAPGACGRPCSGAPAAAAAAAGAAWRAYHAAARHGAGQLPVGVRQALSRGCGAQLQQHARPLHWPSLRDGWSNLRFRSILDVPYEYVVGTGYNARVAVINALYALHPHWAKMSAVLLAEVLTRRGGPFAWCYSMPVTEFEDMRDTEPPPGQLGALQRVLSWARSLLRLLYLLVIFAPAAITAPVAIGYGIKRRRWLVMFRRTLERGGPAFIKWGQWAATRRDLFPPDMCAELEKLHTQAPAHDMPHTEVAIQQAFGFGIHDLFSSFEERPVASGSIGQIHRAVLSDTGARLTGVDEGTLVAVKVRHPGVSEAIERDFALMMKAAALAGRLPALAGLRLEESLKQFAAPLREQVDLGREAFHLHSFNYNFRKLRSSVTFPVPLYPLAAPQCLVETFEPGEHISSYVARGPGAPHNSELAVLGARTMLHMMLVDNLIHADLHPGNILVQLRTPGGAAGKAAATLAQRALQWLGGAVGANLTIPSHWYQRPRIVLLDAGMATHLTPQDQANMVGLFEAFSQLDGCGVADWTLRFSGEEQTCPDPDAFKSDLESFFKRLREQRRFEKGDDSNGAEALSHVLEMVRQYQVSLPGHICATVVTTLVLEGWSFQLDPRHSTLSEVQRMTAALHRGWWRRMLAPAADEEIYEHALTLEHAGHVSA